MAKPSTETEALLNEGLIVVERLKNEVRSATRTWTLVEAFNGSDENHRSDQHAALSRLGLDLTIGTLVKALTRDTLASLYRITDQASRKNQRQTFCRIRWLLDNEDLVQCLDQKWRSTRTALSSDGRDRQIEARQANIQFIKSLVPPSWVTASPKNTRLLDLRNRLAPVRNSILAHALDYNDIQQLTVDEIRAFLTLAEELEAACCLVFQGSSENLQIRRDTYLREADDFWDLSRHSLSFP